MSFGGIGEAIIGAGSSMINTAMQVDASRDANRANQDIARWATSTNVDQSREAREWSANMSNTAHQREVEDLKKAGLNPILSALGGGASTPGASGATAQTAQVRSEMENADASQAFDKAIQAVMTAKDLKQRDEEIANIAADTKNKNIQNDLTRALIKKAESDSKLTLTNAQNAQYVGADLKNQSEVAASKLGKGLTWFDRVIRSIPGISAITPGSSGKAYLKH